MGAIVFTSGGSRKYHFDRGCKAFESAQMLSDLDCGCDTYCTHRLPRMHGLVRMSATKAAMGRKLPCLSCVPEHLREMPEADDFGHRPEWEYIGYCGGCEQCGDSEEAEVCARCATVTTWRDSVGQLHINRRAALWPCTSAIVLGLVEREVAA